MVLHSERVTRAVQVMAIKTGEAAPVYQALHKVVAWHRTFAGGSASILIEVRSAMFAGIQFPMIFRILEGRREPRMSDRIAKLGRAVKMLALHRALREAWLRMAKRPNAISPQIHIAC